MAELRRRLDGGIGELARGDHDGTGRTGGMHHADQLVHVVMRHLPAGPVLALHHDDFLVTEELEVDAAIGPIRTTTTGADMLDGEALATVVVGDQTLEGIPRDTAERILVAIAHGFESGAHRTGFRTCDCG